MGCILADLLQMNMQLFPFYNLRKGLFPGSSWFPLTLNPETKGCIAGGNISPRDQMSIIIKILGTPS